jgi:hypothetical protein
LQQSPYSSQVNMQPSKFIDLESFSHVWFGFWLHVKLFFFFADSEAQVVFASACCFRDQFGKRPTRVR